MLTGAFVNVQRESTGAEGFVFAALLLVECVNELWVVSGPMRG